MAPATKKFTFTPKSGKTVVKAEPGKVSSALEPPELPKPARRASPAKTPALPTLTSWSYSVYTQYINCPLSVCFEKIKRIRIAEPPNPAFVKGNMMHKFAEEFVGVKEKKAPVIIPELAAVTKKLQLFRKLKAKVEADWAFTKDWLPTRWNDWDNCWLRIKVDAVAEVKKPEPLVHIVDWKSGKIYEEHKQQRSLYALAAMQLIDLGTLADGDKKTKIIAEHAYTDTTQTAIEEYTMKDFKPLKAEWMRRVEHMMSDTKYPAKTGFKCRYCKFRKSNGGPCPEDQ